MEFEGLGVDLREENDLERGLMTNEVIAEDKGDISETMAFVGGRLKDVSKYGLEVEVIVWALQAMKNNPGISIERAFTEGCQEWDV